MYVFIMYVLAIVCLSGKLEEGKLYFYKILIIWNMREFLKY